MKIALGSDHRGFAAKEKIKVYLRQLDHEVLDFGVSSTASADYPDAAFPAARAVARHEADMGVLICGTGIGMSISANRLTGIRAALCHDSYTARMSRLHNDANLLVLGGRCLGLGLAADLVDIWLATAFEGERHQRRLDKIESGSAGSPFGPPSEPGSVGRACTPDGYSIRRWYMPISTRANSAFVFSRSRSVSGH